MISSFNVGPKTTAVGLTQFTARIWDEFKLGEHTDKASINRAIDDMRYVKGKTGTGKALRHMAEHSLTETGGARKGVPKVLVLLTDGKADDDIAIGVDKLKNMGVYVFAVGIGDKVDLDQLTEIATHPTVTHMHNPDSFETINEFRKSLIDEICKETDPAPVCERADVDVAFLIDSSGSIHSQDYELMKKWLVDFTKNFAIGDYNAKFAIVQYAKKIESVFTFNDNKTDLAEAVSNMQQIRGQTFTGQALEFAKDQVFTEV